MGVIYCNAFNNKSESLKIINDVITTSDKMKIEGEPIKSTCGGFYLDSSVFKIDEKTGAITKKAVESVSEVIQPYCGGIKLDSSIFERKGDIVDLTVAPMMTMAVDSEIPTANISFTSLDTFDVKLRNQNGVIIAPTKEHYYVVPKGETYSYTATNNVKTVEGIIEVPLGRKVNYTEIITF